MEFTIAANDFPVQLIFPGLLNELHDAGIDLRIRFIPAGIPKVSILRTSAQTQDTLDHKNGGTTLNGQAAASSGSDDQIYTGNWFA